MSDVEEDGSVDEARGEAAFPPTIDIAFGHVLEHMLLNLEMPKTSNNHRF